MAQKDFDIWMVDKTSDGWGSPKNLGAPVNTDALEIGQCLAPDGSLYFSSNREGGKGKFDIYISRFIDGKFLFFNSMRKIDGNDSTQHGNGLGDIYWIYAKIIEELKPEES